MLRRLPLLLALLSPALLPACGGPDAPKRWLRWVPLAADDDPYALYCGDDFAYFDGWVWDRASGEQRPLAEPIPTDIYGDAGDVTCAGRTLYTSPPLLAGAYRSREGGPWEEISAPAGGLLYAIRASRSGRVYRLVLAANGAVDAKLEVSDDDGDTWEAFGAPLPRPTGEVAVIGEIQTVEGFVQVGLIDGDGDAGLVRRSLDGGESLVSTDNFRDIDSPVPYFVDAGLALTYDPYRETRLELYFPSYSMTAEEPLALAAGDWEEVVMAGPPQLLAVPDPAQHPEAFNVQVHPDGHLIRRDGYRTTTAMDGDVRDEVLAGPGCDILDKTVETLGEAEGPGAVTLTHTGSEPAYVGTFQRTRIDWFTGAGMGGPTALEPGQRWTFDADRPVFLVDAAGVCRAVLGRKDGGEQDAGAWF